MSANKNKTMKDPVLASVAHRSYSDNDIMSVVDDIEDTQVETMETIDTTTTTSTDLVTTYETRCGNNLQNTLRVQ
jgi:hypothetical protein